jgi:hypothetical protein
MPSAAISRPRASTPPPAFPPEMPRSIAPATRRLASARGSLRPGTTRDRSDNLARSLADWRPRRAGRAAIEPALGRVAVACSRVWRPDPRAARRPLSHHAGQRLRRLAVRLSVKARLGRRPKTANLACDLSGG